MNIKGLSLNSIPPITIPLRFFLTAPLFGILAALLVLYTGPELWNTRWTDTSLALTHLFTIGFMLMTMLGALYQFIPVMTGQLVPGCRRWVRVIHPSLILGCLSLIGAFLSHWSFLYILALLALSTALGLFALSLIPLLFSQLKNQLIVFLLRILYVVLLVTILLGLFMLLAYSFPEAGINYRSYTDLHSLWGFLGWVVLLIMAISSQVIPMFYVTPEFSTRYLKGLSLIMVATLILRSLIDYSPIVHIINGLLSLEVLFFIFYTLKLLNVRKRKVSDFTLHFLRLALGCLLLSVFFWWADQQWFISMTGLTSSQLEFMVILFLIYGLAVSAIIGMLQKIVSFLVFINLQQLSFNHPGSQALVPNMKNVISSSGSKKQFYAHLLSLFILFLSILFPALVWFAGLIMLVNFGWLAFCLVNAFFLYQNNKREIVCLPELKMEF